MLVECGFVRAITGDGAEFSFRPSLARIAALGPPHEIVALYARLHGPDAPKAAAYVLAGLCDQDDPASLIGWHEDGIDASGRHAPRWVEGEMPEAEQIIIARHLMQHGIVGKARPDRAGDGAFTDRFDAAEFIAAARVHLGLSTEDAEALSMTELQGLLEMKYPQIRAREVPSREQYDALMARIMEKRGG